MTTKWSWPYLTPACIPGAQHFLIPSTDDSNSYECSLHPGNAALGIAKEKLLKAKVQAHILQLQAPIYAADKKTVINSNTYVCINCGLAVDNPEPITPLD